MTYLIENLTKILEKILDTYEKNKDPAELINKFIILKKEINLNLKKYDKNDIKKFKDICSEFKNIQNSEYRKELFKKIDEESYCSNELKYCSNDEILEKSKNISTNTTSTLKTCLNELVESDNMAQSAVIIINLDNDKIITINNNLDQIQSDITIARKLLTRFTKRLSTDKLIWLFLSIIIILIVLIILFKYGIINF
jgi:hypothetical protein